MRNWAFQSAVVRIQGTKAARNEPSDIQSCTLGYFPQGAAWGEGFGLISSDILLSGHCRNDVPTTSAAIAVDCSDASLGPYLPLCTPAASLWPLDSWARQPSRRLA